MSGLYKLSYYSFLALVNKKGKAYKAFTGGAYIDGNCIDGAYADKACPGKVYMDKVYIDRACMDRAYPSKACIDRVYADRACPSRAYTDRVYANGAIIRYRYTFNCILSPLFYLLCLSLAYTLISNISIIISRSVAVYIRVGGFIKVYIYVYYTSSKLY